MTVLTFECLAVFVRMSLETLVSGAVGSNRSDLTGRVRFDGFCRVVCPLSTICCRQAGMQLKHYGQALKGSSDNVRVSSLL